MDIPLEEDFYLPLDAGLVIPGFSVPEYVQRILPWYERFIGEPTEVAPAWEGGGMRITRDMSNTCSASLIVELNGELKVLYACPWDFAPAVVSFGLASENSLREALNKLGQVLDQMSRRPKLR